MSRADLPPHLRFDRQHVERFLRSHPVPKMIRTVLHDADRLPEGGCLLVGNHGPLAVDTGMLIFSMHRDLGLIPRALGDRFMFANAVGRAMARGVAGVEGTPDNAHALLQHGDKVLVYPGGARETTRNSSERYTLNWEGRLGFARVALDAQVPVVPVACIGSDDFLTQVVDKDTVRDSFAGRFLSTFLKADSIPPLYVPKMRASQFHYFFGAPIMPPAATSDDDSAVRAYQLLVKTELEALLVRGREVRRERREAKRELRAQYAAV